MIADTEEHPGLRPALLAAGLAALVLLVLPLGALVRLKWGPLIRLDMRVEAAVHRDAVASSWLATSAKVLTQLGAPALLAVSTVVLVVVLVLRRRRRTALYLTGCVLGAYVLEKAGKLLVSRVRPDFAGNHPISTAKGPSFPSGHATGAAAFYLALAVVLLAVVPRTWRWALLAMAAVLPVVVAATRVVIGVHYVSDVVGGLLIGWGWTAACTALFTAWRAEEHRPVEPLAEGIEPTPSG